MMKDRLNRKGKIGLCALCVLCAMTVYAQEAGTAQKTTPTVKGNVFGGGRMADVKNASASVTATIDIYASTIEGGVFGGNDIKGLVSQGANASAKITIHDKCDARMDVGEVYGGGNGYYTYWRLDGQGNPVEVKPKDAVSEGEKIMVYAWGDEQRTTPLATLTLKDGDVLFPTLANTSVVVGETSGARNGIYLGQVFGGAKNAFVTETTSLTINSGTVKEAYAGNNVGGGVAEASLTINNTRAYTGNTFAKSLATGVNWTDVGTAFGVGTAYGGGNAVGVNQATITVNGGYIGQLFGGNNQADMGNFPEFTFSETNNIYINELYGGGNQGRMTGHANDVYLNMGRIFNPNRGDRAHMYIAPSSMLTIESPRLFVDNVFGGCRQSDVDYSSYVKVVECGALGNVYGGCNVAGIVGAKYPKQMDKELQVKYYLRMAQMATIGGVEYQAGEPYGGTLTDLKAAYPNLFDNKGTLVADRLTGVDALDDKVYYAGSYVEVCGGTVNGNVFAGSDGSGYYELPVGERPTYAPYMTGTGLIVRGGTFSGNLYGGGNLATVGYNKAENDKLVNCLTFVGLDNGQVGVPDDENPIGSFTANTTPTKITGAVYAGGRMASVYGSTDLLVREGVDVAAAAVYAGNDISGRIVANGRFITRLTDPAVETERGVEKSAKALDSCPETETTFNGTSLGDVEGSPNAVASYVRVLPGAKIGTLYGGGNGDYTYTPDPDNGEVKIYDKNEPNKLVGTYPFATANYPTMADSWLDIKGEVTTSYGGGNLATVDRATTYITADARVGTAFGGGNAATVTESATVYVDCNDAGVGVDAKNNVGTLFGGNNIADMNIVPKVNLLCGNIGTVYGGGNEGDMKGARPFIMDADRYLNPKAHRLEPLKNFTFKYLDKNDQTSYDFDVKHVPHFKGTNLVIDSDKDGLRVGTVFAGCRAANVDNSSYVRISKADYIGDVYGGCDIAGSVGANPGTIAEDYVTFYEIDYDEATKKYNLYSARTEQSLNGIEMCNPSSYVTITGSTISGNVYGGGNGDYTYTEENGEVKVTDESGNLVATLQASYEAPWNRATSLRLLGGTVKKNVYGGGNRAKVGTEGVNGMSILYLGGAGYGAGHLEVEGEVFGGCRNADVTGTISVLLKEGVEIGSVYAGNDVSGSISGTRQAETGLYGMDMQDPTTSYGGVTLKDNAVVYVRMEPNCTVGSLFGGGKGGYENVEPPHVQSSLLDIRGKVTNVYGGGNSAPINSSKVYVTGEAQVGTVYGGCNQAYVTPEKPSNTLNPDLPDGMTYVVMAPFVKYSTTQVKGDIVLPTVTGHIFGGCNTSGDVEGMTRVVLAGGTVAGNVYGGGNQANITKGNTQVLVLGGTVNGSVYGGGLGETGQAKGQTKDTYVYVLDDRLTADGLLKLNADKTAFDFEPASLEADRHAWQCLPLQMKKADGSVLRTPVTIKGNVFGGGQQGTVTGETHVQIGS